MKQYEKHYLAIKWGISSFVVKVVDFNHLRITALGSNLARNIGFFHISTIHVGASIQSPARP